MYLFLAITAIYTLYIFGSKYLKNNYNYNKENFNDGHLDDALVEDDDIEPKEIELIEQNNDGTNDKFIEEEEEKGWAFW